jgi:hypothetical protein
VVAGLPCTTLTLLVAVDVFTLILLIILYSNVGTAERPCECKQYNACADAASGIMEKLYP